MDVAEADADVKLYKASGELLLELQAKIPRLVLVSKSQTNHSKYRKWVIHSKVYEVTRLLDSFQEWPQLLDPHLAALVQVLVDAYLTYCILHPNEYLREHSIHGQIVPLPRAVARILYSFCKVRGYKVIVRLLNNEPKYVEPLLSCFRLWTPSPDTTHGNAPSSTMTWEESYIHLLWLSHLMLAPFELSIVSSLAFGSTTRPAFRKLCADLPAVSSNLAVAGLYYLNVPSKARDAASILLVRLALRSDMQKLGLAERLVNWAVAELQSPEDPLHVTEYHYIGLLELLFGIINSASDSEAAPFLNRVFRITFYGATSSDMQFRKIRDSAPARKLLVKIMRSTVIHAIANSNNQMLGLGDLDIDTMLEECIQILLENLADKDMPVRQAASKALSLICLKLDPAMAAEVVDAVVGSLEENVLLENLENGRLYPITDLLRSASTKHKKNLNAVDPLKWHGCMLTLGHLLFRRSLPTFQLPAVIEALVMGLNFEQRSNVGTSVGVSVRDAACFGIWSLARKYSTGELNNTPISESLLPNPTSFSGLASMSTLQLIATHLVVSACLDPSGNLRRGSSAALQELIGRHPDAVAEGIPVVQAVDYHTVARRSRAVTEVAIAASKLSVYYHGALLYALLAWRGARAIDSDSRRQAAQAIEQLVLLTLADNIMPFIQELVLQIGRLKVPNTGSNAAARHGLLYILASIMESLSHDGTVELRIQVFQSTKPILLDLVSAAGAIGGRVTPDVENVMEAISKLILAAAKSISTLFMPDNSVGTQLLPSQWASSVISVLERCTVTSDKNLVTNIAAQANVAVLSMLQTDCQVALISSWLDPKQQSKADFFSKGRIATLGRTLGLIESTEGLKSFHGPIVSYIADIIGSPNKTEVKVNAMQSIKYVLANVSNLDSKSFKMLAAAIHLGLADYTIDQRGDIGSILRLESINAAEELLGHVRSVSIEQQTLPLLAKLAAEKLVKVRFRAWRCVEGHLKDEIITKKTFKHQADVSSLDYFRNLLGLLHSPLYTNPLLSGFASTVSGETEEVSRAACEAMLAFIEDHDVTSQQRLLSSMVQFAVIYAPSTTSVDDREAVPVVDFLAFLVEHILAPRQVTNEKTWAVQIWNSCMNVNGASSSLIRIEAMIRLYSASTLLGASRIRALEKLTRLLLHRWPKIRGAAADAIFWRTGTQSITICNWNASVSDNKPAVLALRKELKVVGATDPSTTANSSSSPKTAV